MAYPLSSLKYFGPSAVKDFTLSGLLMGQQSGGVGTAFGLGSRRRLYLILRGHVRWEIPVSFIAGVLITAFSSGGQPGQFGGPFFHLLTGLDPARRFFLAGEDSSSPVNWVPCCWQVRWQVS